MSSVPRAWESSSSTRKISPFAPTSVRVRSITGLCCDRTWTSSRRRAERAMQFLKDAHLNVKHHFEKGGKLEFFYPLWEAQFTGLFTPGEVTRTASHVRDGLD